MKKQHLNDVMERVGVFIIVIWFLFVLGFLTFACWLLYKLVMWVIS